MFGGEGDDDYLLRRRYNDREKAELKPNFICTSVIVRAIFLSRVFRDACLERIWEDLFLETVMPVAMVYFPISHHKKDLASPACH